MTFARVFMMVGVGLCIAGLCSCARHEQPQAQPERLTGDPSTGHAVHSARLHKIMSRLGSTSAKRWPQEIESDRAADAEELRAQRFEEARQLAAAMSLAAEEIPSAVADTKLEGADRERFMAQVERLRGQAQELEAAAGRHDFEGMWATLKSVRATCNGCHSQFSDVTRPIKLPRSAM